jgi:hypothetical protein
MPSADDEAPANLANVEAVERLGDQEGHRVTPSSHPSLELTTRHAE